MLARTQHRINRCRRFLKKLASETGNIIDNEHNDADEDDAGEDKEDGGEPDLKRSRLEDKYD
jgi:hypothetical protein